MGLCEWMDRSSLIEKFGQNLEPTSLQRTRLWSVADEVCMILKKVLPQAHCQVGGSVAKDTWLAERTDIDIFVAFPLKEYAKKSGELCEMVEQGLKKVFMKSTIERLHGSRDYFHFEYKGYTLEIVPIIAITRADEACNITDISPLHVAWVVQEGKRLTNNGKILTNEIRLAKQFCKAQRIYGAESYISGVSGYVVEILVIYYGSFEKFIEGVAKWKEGQVIDPSLFYAKGMARFNLNSSKMRSPLILIDPVDKNRNAAAAFGVERWQRLRRVAVAFLKEPSEDFFTAPSYAFSDLVGKVKSKEKSSKKVSTQKRYLVYLEIEPLCGKVDVVGAKLVKAYDYCMQQLTPFGIVESDWDWPVGKNAVAYFIVRTKLRPTTQEVQGPPLTMKEALSAFKTKHADNFEKEGRIYARVKVGYPALDDQLTAVLGSKYFSEKISRVVGLKLV